MRLVLSLLQNDLENGAFEVWEEDRNAQLGINAQ